jgi:Bacterial archaeo-eukaryotic release factor family 2
MPPAPNTLPLLRLGRLELGPELRAFQPGPAASDLVVTATVEVPDSPSEQQNAWDVAWADAVREASGLGADERTARALAAGAGDSVAGGTWVVVAAHGQVLLARRLPHGSAAASVRVGPLPHLRELAAFAARRPACVVVLADRDDAAVIAHAAGDLHPARRFEVDLPRDPHPDRPPALHHGERHLTGPEPEGGGERNAELIAARVSQAAASVAAHLVLGAGDQHILDAIAGHLPASLLPVTTIASGPVSTQSDDQLSARIGAALDGITAEAVGAVGDLVASSAAAAQDLVPAAVRGIDAVAQQLAEEQVAVLLVAADISTDGGGASYRIGQRPTWFLTGDADTGTEVPLDDGLVWAALHQDSIVVQLPDRSGPLAGQPAAALLRRGQS